MRATSWTLRRGQLSFENGPALMAIINVTPDSFSDGGSFFDPARAVERGLQALDEGASILDIGGESTRPGASVVTEEEELARVLPVVRELRARSDAWLSIDTTRASVADACLREGADIINDISGLRRDPFMARVIAEHDAGVCIMHSLGDAQTMHDAWSYDEHLQAIERWLVKQRAHARAAGIAEARLCIDPGFGFSKDNDQNYQLSHQLESLVHSGAPVLVGVSRKRMIRACTGDDALAVEHGNSAFHTWATLCGVQILRVHDVIAGRAACSVAQAIVRAKTPR